MAKFWIKNWLEKLVILNSIGDYRQQFQANTACGAFFHEQQTLYATEALKLMISNNLSSILNFQKNGYIRKIIQKTG